MNEYIKQANDFCNKYNTTIKVVYSHTGSHFADDKEKRDIYNIEIQRVKNGKILAYDFTYGDSMFNTEKNQETIKRVDGKRVKSGKRKQVVTPSNYDILACLTKYDCGDFDDFFSDFGYEINSEKDYIKVKQIYLNVKEEYKNVHRLFSDCIEELEEIQ